MCTDVYSVSQTTYNKGVVSPGGQAGYKVAAKFQSVSAGTPGSHYTYNLGLSRSVSPLINRTTGESGHSFSLLG
jgi:hypothetical protein